MSSKKDHKHDCKKDEKHKDKDKDKDKCKHKKKDKHKHDHKHDHGHCDKKKDHDCGKKCDCKDKDCKAKECKHVPDFVKDCICLEFSVPHGREQTIFTTNGLESIIASGFISYDCGDANFITVRFFNGSVQVGNSIQVFQDSSVAFSQSEFTRITVSCPAVTTTPSDLSDCPGVCDGEICLNIRYPLDFKKKSHH
jgi:hypothetical protein